ncbi:MAG: hypothetical protein FWH32_02360 [Clostridiales bacterium]|nr:hypothetical protein [Clostridiales bacterium]
MYKKMKRFPLAAALVFVLAAALLAGCSGGGGGEPAEPISAEAEANGGAAEALSDPTDVVLERIMADADATLGGASAVGQALPDPVTAENAPAMLGIMPDDFVSFVSEATAAQDIEGMDAIQIAVIMCLTPQYVEIVDEMIVNVFDPGKWEQMFPERALTMVSGSYILLAVGSVAETEALADAFSVAAGGSVQEPNIFYTGETGG